MITRTHKEWEELYRSKWRPKFEHLSKEIRGKVVRGCVGKALYESKAEAKLFAQSLPKRGKLFLNIYICNLCGGIHMGNSRTKPMKERAITGERAQ